MTKHTFLNRAIIILLLFLGLLQALLYFDSSFYGLPPNFAVAIRLFVFMVLAFLVTSVFVRFTIGSVTRIFGDESEPEQRLFITKAYSIVLYFIAISVVMLKLGLTLNNLSIMLGFAATGFAFAIREVILSFIVWFMLLTKKPFRIGDFIKVGEEEGKVMHIGTFYVLIDNTPDKRDDFVRIPNKVFLEKPIQNFGKHDILDRIDLPLKAIPKDIESRLRQLEKELSGLKISQVALKSGEPGYFISISFRSPYLERKQSATKIFAKAALLNKDIIKEYN